MHSNRKTILAVICFSIAMATLESAVVVYLRALYYPNGFDVSLKVSDQNILIVELLRELSTIIMLGALAFLAGKTKYSRLAYFLISFAVWDIFYYVWLKVFLDWPTSLLEWDILFLIPVVWLGPVLSPIICSLTMMVLGGTILYSKEKLKFTKVSVFLMIAGCIIILFTYMVDYTQLIVSNGFLSDYPHLLQNEEFTKLTASFKPEPYRWGLFWCGEGMILMAVVSMIFKIRPVSFLEID